MPAIEPYQLLILAVTAFVASTIAAVTGTGGGVLLLPVMVLLFGVRDAVPMYAVAQLIGNLSRVVLNRRAIRFEVTAWFVLGAVPAAVLGAWLFARAPESLLMRLLGGFLLLSVVGHRRLRERCRSGFRARWFLPIGAVFALISALVGSAGPFLAPWFLAFGLVKGAYIGTEALGTAVMHVTKLMTYGQTGVLSAMSVGVGLALGPIMILGSILGKRLVDRMSPEVFVRAVEWVVVAFGLWFLIRG